MRVSGLDRNAVEERKFSRTPKKENKFERKEEWEIGKKSSIEELSFPSKSRYTERKVEWRPKVISTVSRIRS